MKKIHIILALLLLKHSFLFYGIIFPSRNLIFLLIYVFFWDLDISTTELMQKFLSEAKEYVKENGAVYFTWCSDTDVDPIRNFLSKYKYKEVIEEKAGRTWYLFEVKFIS